KSPPTADAALRVSDPPESTSPSRLVRLLTVSPPWRCVTVRGTPRSITTSSPEAGTRPVLQLWGSSQKPLASTFQLTTANSRRSPNNASRTGRGTSRALRPRASDGRRELRGGEGEGWRWDFIGDTLGSLWRAGRRGEAQGNPWGRST